ncbi:tyrosine-type recombinase/integrase [Ralstonia pseudosolanacearum]|uniref:tyrosine-type recombinase/integrase n=1 Tax=Ralstonia pseudosolanacearum TaxID=1310165 RepID=UPI003CF0052E
MGRRGSGVEVRATSIRLSFSIDGKPQRHTLMLNGKPLPPTPANVKYAHRIAIEIRDRIRHGSFSLSEYFPAAGGTSTTTVKAWLETWLATQRVEDSTRSGYSAAIRFWEGGACDEKRTPMGTLALRALRLSHVLTVIAQRPDLSGKTINNYVSVLRDGLSLAVTEKLITSNPAEDVPRAKHQSPLPDPFSREEAELLVEHAARQLPMQVYHMIEFWFWSGLRTSELLGLEWASVDLATGTIVVANAYVAGKQKQTTKTAVARTVRLNSRSMAALQRQRAQTETRNARVFHDPRYDLPWHDEDAFRRTYWAPMLRQLGIRYRRPYNMRHSYATIMLMAGMTPAFCAKQLGHSVEMFLKRYTKWIDGDQDAREMARLEASLSILPTASSAGTAE